MTAKTDACGVGSVKVISSSASLVVGSSTMATESVDVELPTVPDNATDVGGREKMNGMVTKKSKLKTKKKKKVKKIRQERWVCDVCKVKSFLEFEEACAHEEECRRLKQQEHDGKSTLSEEEKKEDSKPTNGSNEGLNTAEVTPSPTSSSEILPSPILGDCDVSTRINTLPNKPKGKEKEKRSRSTGGGRRSSRLAAASAKPAPAILPSGPKSKSNAATSKAPGRKNRQGSLVPKTDKKQKSKTVKVPAKKSSDVSAPKLASIFSRKTQTSSSGATSCAATDAILAEHKAADFFARRKLEKEAERERQRKREEHKRQKINGEEGCGGKGKKDTVAAFFRGGAPSGATNTNKNDKLEAMCVDGGCSSSELLSALKSFPRKKISVASASAVLPVAPRFPVPNHIYCDFLPEDSVRNKEQMLVGKNYAGDEALEKLRKMEKFPSIYPVNEPGGAASECAVPFIQLGKDQIKQQYDTKKIEGNALYQAFSSVLVPPALEVGDSESSGGDNFSGSNQLWCNKYSIKQIPHDICGDENKAAAEKLVSFINDWREHRNEALLRRENERKSSKKGNKRSQRKREYYSWCDSDDDLFSDADDEGGLCSVFVLTGPTGSGKTSLVHAAAEQCECITLEINTTDKRGGQALKRAIQESTQSHSSLALLRRENSTLTADDDEENSDTDESDNSDIEEDDESDDDKDQRCRRKKGQSLALVLIDEVDNLFENNGDAGFWSALGQLTKKAKCPIILTATAVPCPLYESSTIRFQCASMVRPTPLECASKMCHIAKMEGMGWKREGSSTNGPQNVGGGDKVKDGLCNVAKLCRCDLRQIINEMQSFSHASVAPFDCPQHHNDIMVRGKQGRGLITALKVPVISGISPRMVASACPSIITIRGTNFQKAVEQFRQNKGAKLAVKIGDQPCLNFRVMDDSTIIAVCPMSCVPSGVNSSGVFENTFEDCLTCRYAPVSIEVTGTGGIVVQSDVSVSEGSSDVDVSVPIGPRIWNIEYDFPSMEYELETLSGRTEKERKRKQRDTSSQEENGTVYSSSSDDDFMSPKKRKCDVTDQVVSEAKDEMIASDDSAAESESSKIVATDVEKVDDAFPEVREEIDAKILLENGVEDFLLKQQGASSKSCCPCELLTEMEENDVQSSDQLRIDDNVSPSEIDLLAKQMEIDSDAALLEDFFCNSAPLLSGSVKGFGSDLLDESATMSQGKLARNGNSKPPSIEKLYASGWNDSAFFFGSSNTYMTYPRRVRDKRILSWAEAHTRGKSQSTSDCCSPATTEAGVVSNVTEDQDASYEEITALTQEDMYFPSSIPYPLTSLPHIIWNADVTRSTCSITRTTSSDIFFFHQLKEERALNMLKLTFPIMPEGSKTNTFSIGLAFDKDCLEITNHAVALRISMGDGLDRRFSLDYISALRNMAFSEAAAEKRYSDEMKDENDGSSSRRVSRRRNRGGRRHYFNKLTSGWRQEELLDKKTGAHLAKMILSNEQSSSFR